MAIELRYARSKLTGLLQGRTTYVLWVTSTQETVNNSRCVGTQLCLCLGKYSTLLLQYPVTSLSYV